MEKVNIWDPAGFTRLQWWFGASRWQRLALCILMEEWDCLSGTCSWVPESHKWGHSHLSGCEARLRGGGEGDLIALLLSNFCYGNLFLICSIWILGKWTIWEVYRNSSLDKQLNKEWKICILSEGTTKKCSHMAMISSVFNKGLAQESSPVDTDQIYHCGNVTWLVQCLNCESTEQRDVGLQHVQYLSCPFPLTGADFVFNIIEEWFFIVKVTNEFVLEVCFGFSLQPTPPLCCSGTLEPVIRAENKIMRLFKMCSEWKVCWIMALRKWKCSHTRKWSPLRFAALSIFFRKLAEKHFISLWGILDVSSPSWKEGSCFTHHNLTTDSG